MADCISVDTMAQLRAIKGSHSLEGMVNVKCFSSIGDRGGGNFIWDPNSRDEDNNGTIVEPEGRVIILGGKPIKLSGRWIRQFSEEINVCWFGAKGDTKGIGGEYKGTVSVSGTTGKLTAVESVFSPGDLGKKIVVWDSKGNVNASEKPFVVTKFVSPNEVDLDKPPTKKMTEMCFAWGTDDTEAIQDAWRATWDKKNNRVYRLIFPTGTYCVTNLTSITGPKDRKYTLTSQGMNKEGKVVWDLPSAYFEGVGKVLIVSPNSLGNVVSGYAVEGLNEIIKFDENCGPVSITNMIFQGISTSDAGIVKYSDGTSATLPSPFNAAGEAGPFNQRVGIYYHGRDAIICKNVEVSNMPCAGLLIDSGVGQSLIENSYFHANGLFNIKVFPGERFTLLDNSPTPGVKGPVTKVIRAGSIKLIRTRVEDSIPVAYGYLSYGIEMGGCDFTAIDCDFVNNAGNGIGNDDPNPSTMTFDNCRFAFGKNNGKLSFPRTLTNVHIDTTTDPHTVDINPFPSPGSIQSAPAIFIPDVFWSFDDPIFSHGTAGTAFLPKITITGIANQPVILKIICTSPGVRGQWTLRYTTDNGETFYPSEKTSETSKIKLPIYSSKTRKDTGLTLNIDASIPLDSDTLKATVGDLWLADNTYSYCLPWKEDDTKITTVRAAQYSSSEIETTSLTWVEISTSALLTVDDPCQNFSCTNCLFKGTDATTHQFSAIMIKGHTHDPRSYDPPTHSRRLESQRVIKIIGNTFDTFDADVIIYSRAWTTKEIKIQNNVFVDSPFTNCIVHDPQNFDKDPITRQNLRFDKKAISKIIHLSGNTYVDVGKVVLTSGGLITINDERIIYTGKSYYPTIPYTPPILPKPSAPPVPIAQFFSSSYHFNISTKLGRVGRVIRRNNTISGQNPAKLYNPETTPPTLTASFPTWWSWHEGYREEIDVFPTLIGGSSYFSYGFIGFIEAGQENKLKFKRFTSPSSTPGRFADRFQTGAEISIMYWDNDEKKYKDVTWGGLPYVVLTHVDRTMTRDGDVCATTALPANNTVSLAGAEVFAPFYYGGIICMSPGTFGKCTAHANTSKGNYEIIIPDDVQTLCPQQIISISNNREVGRNVTFESPNASAKYTEFTEIVDVIGNEGGPGSIIVRDAPHDEVTNAEISFVSPRLVLYDKIALTPVAQKNWV